MRRGASILGLVLMTTFLNVAHGHGRAILARWEAAIAPLEETLARGGTLAAAVDRLVEEKGRLQLFKLQSLCRIYADHADVFDGHRETFRELENRLGGYIDTTLFLQYAIDVRAPAEVLPLLTAERDRRKAALATFLGARGAGWIRGDGEPTVLERFRDDLRRVRWLPYAEDREYVITQLRRQLRKLTHNEWNMRILQADGGLHHFRRQIRWFLLYVQSLNGLVLLTEHDNPLPRWLRDPFATSPYVTSVQPSQLEQRPIYIPKSLFVALTAYSENLGLAKDVGEAVEEWLSTAILAGGARSTEEAARKLAVTLAKRHPKYVDPVAVSDAIHADVTTGGWVDTLRKILKGDWPVQECVDSMLD